MAKPKKPCIHCGEVRTPVAKGCCWKCYAKLYPQSERRACKSQYQTIKLASTNPTDNWPKAELITIYHTSDGKEHGSELEAVKWQLDIERTRCMRAVKGASHAL